MPKFKVLRRVDAWIDYVSEVDAATAAEASEIACARPANYVWARIGEEEFANAIVVTIDEAGGEVPDTQRTRG